MCTVLLPPGGYLIAINKYIVSYHIIPYHIISYHVTSRHIISYRISYHISCRVVSYHIISWILSWAKNTQSTPSYIYIYIYIYTDCKIQFDIILLSTPINMHLPNFLCPFHFFLINWIVLITFVAELNFEATHSAVFFVFLSVPHLWLQIIYSLRGGQYLQ